ncbi:uncharacterized protein [Arachis hypogaea]|uniref:uncharacterized protein n=1 Tax=Arachis hypogaea TaxID=3818 RepID=UPI003B220989
MMIIVLSNARFLRRSYSKEQLIKDCTKFSRFRPKSRDDVAAALLSSVPVSGNNNCLLWHAPPGHPSVSVVSQVLKSCHIPLKSINFVCSSCFIGKDTGIMWRLSCPYEHQQNGATERKHRHIVEIWLTLLATASMPKRFWGDVFMIAVRLINSLPTLVLNNVTPYERLFNSKPDYMSFKIFGCLCFSYTRPYNFHKIDDQSEPCVFLGRGVQHKGYKCLTTARKIILSTHVFFIKQNFLSRLVLLHPVMSHPPLAPLWQIFFFLLFLITLCHNTKFLYQTYPQLTPSLSHLHQSTPIIYHHLHLPLPLLSILFRPLLHLHNPDIPWLHNRRMVFLNPKYIKLGSHLL